MKITRQSPEELVLTEGSASGIIVGAALIVAGALAGYYLHAAHPIAIWIALAVVAGGVAIILFSSSITVHASKTTGKLSYQKKRLIGAQNSTYAITDVFRIETRKQWQVQNTATGNQGETMPQEVLVFQSVIVFKDGRELALDHRKNASQTTVGSVVLMGGQGGETAVAMQVANFLRVPFEEIAPPNFGMGVNIMGGPGI